MICDDFETHEILEILEFCFENQIILCRLFSHTSHWLQPCDKAVFVPLKSIYRERVDRLERGGVNTIDKEHFTSLYSSARETTFTSKNIKAGFAVCELTPFNSDRVLKDILKPLTKSILLKANEVIVRSRLQDEVVRTPTTPVSEEKLISLQNMIIQQDAYALDETSKQSLQRHVQKLVSATQMSFVKNALQQDQIQFLTAINNEVKIRRSTKSHVLEKAKVMSYEDLVAKSTEREAKEQEKAKKKTRRDRKYKSQKKASASKSVIDEQFEKNEITLEKLYRASVTQM